MKRAALAAACGAWALLAAAAARGQDGAPQVRLAPNPASLEETLMLEIEVPGSGSGRMIDATFKLDNLRRASGPMVSTSFSIVNGRSSSSQTLSWRLQPIALGPARVYDIQIQVGDSTVDGGAATATIQRDVPARRRQGTAPQSPFGGLDDDPLDRLFRPRRPQRRTEPRIFLRAEVSPQRPWAGQQILYSLHLYTQANIEAVVPKALPEWQGFWTRELPEPQDARAEVETVEVDGESFGRVRLLRRALFARRDGVQEIEPAQINLRARLPDNSPFGLLSARRADVERTSNAVTVDVRPLPPAPPGFSGIVGKISLEGSLEPAELAVGDAATLTLRIDGQGNLQGAPEPRLPDLDGVKVFPPQRQSSERVRGNRVFGTRTWQYVLVPERPGEWTLPAIVVPYFDPDAGAYVDAIVGDLHLIARGATALAGGDGATVRLHPIRTAALPSAAARTGFAALLPWLFAAPLLIAAGLLAARSRTGSGKANERRALAARLDQAAGEDDPRRVAGLVEDAWRQFLEKRFEIPPGVASTQWQRALESRGVDAERARALVELADDVHYLRYAPKLSSTDDLRRELIDRSRKLLRGL